MQTYKRYEAQGCLWILECEEGYEWDGKGYPSAAKVWQCPLSNAEELAHYEALWASIVAESVRE